MNYYLKDKLQELRTIAAENPSVRVDFSHPSVSICRRDYASEAMPSVIDLRGPTVIGVEAVTEFMAKLNAIPSWKYIVDDFGDVTSVSTFRSRVLDSHAWVSGTDGNDCYVGPIRELLPNPPFAAQPAPSTQEVA